MNKIFDSLKFLGLDFSENLEIYKKEENNVSDNKLYSEPDIETLLYDKNVTCPVCNQKFSGRVVKSYAAKIESKDTDAFIRYKNVNPYFYDILLCPICGYAALQSEFFKIKSYQKEKIQMQISNHWHGKNYPQIYDAAIAIERYKIALLNAVVAEFKDSTKAILCLKIGWMYRLLEDSKREKEYLKKSIEGLLIAYEKEYMPIYGMNQYNMMYLIGELYRRCENYDDAKIWFGKILVSRCDSKLKEKARDMLDLTKEEIIKDIIKKELN